jgi:transposase
MVKRRKYTEEFKREAVRLVMGSEGTLTSVAADLGIDRSVVGGWVKKAEQGRLELTVCKPLKTESQSGEVEQLRRELAKVRMERDILKKALGYFAKDPT